MARHRRHLHFGEPFDVTSKTQEIAGGGFHSNLMKLSGRDAPRLPLGRT